MERRVRFELLYGAHAPAVKAYLLRRAHPTTVDDLLAEVFLVAWRRFEDVPIEPLPWLLGVARRQLSTQRRGERRRIALDERLAREVAPAGAGEAELGVLGGALGRLSESDRELLLLVAWEQLTPAQAAGVLGIRPSTARVRLHRARRRLASALARGHGSAAYQALTMEVSP
jgi:RNA polymerase sigma-70 factor (ECF subfamily)